MMIVPRCYARLRTDHAPQLAIARLESVCDELAGPVIVLRGGQIAAAIQRFVNGEWDRQRLASWADFFEHRDDVGIPSGLVRGAPDLLFELSSPALFAELNVERARQLIAEARSLDVA